MRPLAPLLAALSLVAPAFAAPHVLYGKSHYSSSATLNQDQLVYHGGAVETTPSGRRSSAEAERPTIDP